MNAAAIGFVNLFFVGILAGEEFAIRYGVRSSITRLEQQAHIQLRQLLIRRLRILVPVLFATTILSGVAVTLVDGFGGGFAFRCLGLLALFAFIGVTLTGTVPINKAALSWSPDAPPKNWQTLVRRWEQLDTVRCWLALIGFALFLAAMALQ